MIQTRKNNDKQSTVHITRFFFWALIQLVELSKCYLESWINETIKRQWDCITPQHPIEKKNKTSPPPCKLLGNLLQILQTNLFFPKWLIRGTPSHNLNTDS